MELSYKIIKKNYIDKTSSNRFFIDTEMTDLMENIRIEESDIKADIEHEEKVKIIESIESYKQKVSNQITSERKNIIETSRIMAEQEAIKIREEAYREGYTDGYTKSIDGAKAEARDIKAKGLSLMEEAKKQKDKYLRDNKKNIYNLAKAMAENIINHTIDIDDENILLLIEPILNEYLKEEDIAITTTKKGKALLEKHKDRLMKICPNTRFIFLEDRSIDQNGFIIENKESIVDLQIRVQLENMVKAISDLDG